MIREGSIFRTNIMSKPANILVISDLHLGEDLSPAAGPVVTKQLAILERQLTSFLRHYTNKRRNGQPWRLVINGDMVDFLQICVLPNDARLATKSQPDPDEKIHGLRRKPEVARVKISAVIQRHREVFRALAHFVASGNFVEIICGNHDVEFHWPLVQKAFRDGVIEVWQSATTAGRTEEQVQAFHDAISFHPWFYYEPGVIWIEHGHQYDACCSFEHNLEPVAPNGEHIAPNIDSAGLRYVTNQIEEAEPHAQAEWSALGHVRFGLSLGARGLLRLASCYAAFVMSMLRVWRGYSSWSAENRKRAVSHRDRLLGLAKKWSISAGVLRQVDNLRHRPAISNLRRLLSVLMLDTVLIYTFMVALVVVFAFTLPFLAALIASAISVVSARLAHQWANGKRTINPEMAMRTMPEKILHHIDAQFVLFGHTHEPLSDQLADGKWHFNTGTWMPTGKPGLLHAFTHVVLEHHEHGPSAQLRQWRDGASRSYTPNWAPANPIKQPAATEAAAEAATAAAAEIQAA